MAGHNPSSEIEREHRKTLKYIQRLAAIVLVLAVIVAAYQSIGGENAMVVNILVGANFFLSFFTTGFIREDKKLLSQEMEKINVQSGLVIWIYIMCTYHFYALYYATVHRTDPPRSSGETSNATTTKSSRSKTSECLKCRTKISTEAVECPACGYEPKEGYRGDAQWYGIWAIFFGLTVVGLVLAIPLWVSASKLWRKSKGMRPTNTEPDAHTTTHL